MNKFKFVVMSISLIFLLTGCIAGKKIKMDQLNNGDKNLIKINDPRWDGVTVPTGEQGLVCGGEDPHFPSITFKLKKLSDIFGSKVIAIKMRAYDINWKGGSHGKWYYEFNVDSSDFISPKIPSETLDMPNGVVGISRHTGGRKFSSGYYLAPSSCVAKRGHKYFTDITFELESGEVVKTTLSQGKY